MAKIKKLFGRCLQLAVLSLLASSVSAEDISRQISQLQAEVDAITRDVSVLEQNLLFPPITRVKVYLSLAADANFNLRTVSMRIDGREQTYHVYSADEVAALRLGGVQTLWEGNIALGHRQLTAFFEGVDRRGDAVRGNVTFDFEKTLEGRVLELQVKGGRATTFAVKDRGSK